MAKAEASGDSEQSKMPPLSMRRRRPFETNDQRCPRILSTLTLTTELESVSACRTIGTSSRKKPVVDWFEIISENFMVDGGRPLEVLDSILEQYRVVQHGVAIYFGSADKLNREHLKKLKRLVQRTNTPWLSDHLCWGSVDGRYTHDLLPMPYTFAAAKVTAQKIREARDFLEVPICVENVSSYAEFHASEMTEWEFLSEVVELADCGILLDVNNIYVSSQNHNFDPYDYLNNIPHHRVGQIHIAGHSKFENTSSTPTITRFWTRFGRCMATRSSESVTPPHCSSGMTGSVV